MASSVTVPGPGGSTITQTFGNTFNQQLAQSISNALQAALSASNLFIQTTSGGLAPTNTSGKVGELLIEPNTTSGVTVPASANYSFVIDNSTGPDTIYGSPGLSIMGGGGAHTIVDPAVITLGDTTSGSINNITISGSGDNVAVGNGTNTLTGTGSGTMSGGTGKNTFIDQGIYIITSQGSGDTVVGGDGAATVNASGANASIVGGDGKLTGHISGTGDTVLGGGGAMAVTVSGTSDTVVGGSGVGSVNLTGSSVLVTGGLAPLTVMDGGTGDTINAGLSVTSVTAPGGSFVRGGAGPLNFVGGTGGSTIVGSSGNSTIMGGSGQTILNGGAGGAMTYVNITPGSLVYGAGSGNETLDASLSKGSSTLYGSSDATGSGVALGGVGNDLLIAGKGAETMTGSGGHNVFEFFALNGGAAAVDTVTDLSSIDLVLLQNYGTGAAAAAMASAVTVNGSTTITLSDNTKITFTGVTSGAALSGHIGSTA